MGLSSKPYLRKEEKKSGFEIFVFTFFQKLQDLNCFSFSGTKSRPPDLRAVTKAGSRLAQARNCFYCTKVFNVLRQAGILCFWAICY